MHHGWLIGIVCMLAAAATAPPAVPEAQSASAPPPTGKVILTQEHFWRKHYTFSPPKVTLDGAKANKIDTDSASRAKFLAGRYLSGLRTPAPPAGWEQPDFDDSAWQLARGRQFVVGDGRAMKYTSADANTAYLRGTDPFVLEIGTICQRGKFRVTDRAKVRGLKLSVAYRGGFVAYLNGKEVARASLPQGKLDPETPAAPYGLDAFLTPPDAKGNRAPWNWYTHRDKRYLPAWSSRERHFAPREIGPGALRDGLNVLAIELRRTDYPPRCAQRKVGLCFATVGLSLLSLTAEGDAGAVEELTTPRGGLQVWNRDLTRPVGREDGPSFDEKLRPIRIVGARNGTFSGQVIVRGDTPLDGLSAAASALTQVGGKGTIAPASVSIRYGAVNPTNAGGGLGYLQAVLDKRARTDLLGRDPKSPLHGRFDSLLDEPPAGAKAMPVWVTVKVPKDAPPGSYKGTLTITAGAARAEVPIDLYLADWTLPGLADYVSLINIYQSPDTLAAHYKLDMWSEEHWRMIERSLRLMGETGNIGLFFPLLAESQMGNAESMVVWISQGDGSYKHDFANFDRYLATALKYHTRLRFLSLNVWGGEAQPWRGRPAAGALVTVLDPKTGKKSNMKLPDYGTGECEKLWRPLLTAIRDRLAKRGLKELIMLGLPYDMGPDWRQVAMFRRILPAAPWIRESHYNVNSYRYDAKDAKAAAPVAYNSIVWGGGVPDPAAKRMYGWRYNPKHLVMTFNRAGASALSLRGFAPPWSYRMWMESTLAGGRNGNGRVGGDYWRIGMRPRGPGRISSEAGGGCGGTLFGSYLRSSVGQVGLGNSTTDLFAAGPAGPVSTVRLENAREGNQEAEARIAIEKALLDKGRPLPADLADECQRFLDRRTNILRMWTIRAADIARLNWQDRSRLLYDLAGKVDRARAR